MDSTEQKPPPNGTEPLPCFVTIQLDPVTGNTHLAVSDGVTIVVALGLLRLAESMILERAKANQKRPEKPLIVFPSSPRPLGPLIKN